MTKFEFHLFTAFRNYFDCGWFEKCSNKSTLLSFKDWLEQMLAKVNKELRKYAD
jgi:hypothetical protein